MNRISVEEGQQRRARAGLDVGPRRAAEVGQHEVVLDVPVRREHQRLAAGAVGQPVEVLAGQAVQPGQPVGAGDDDDVAVAAVDQSGALGQQPLLAERVAVVGGDGTALDRRRRRAREEG